MIDWILVIHVNKFEQISWVCWPGVCKKVNKSSLYRYDVSEWIYWNENDCNCSFFFNCNFAWLKNKFIPKTSQRYKQQSFISPVNPNWHTRKKCSNKFITYRKKIYNWPIAYLLRVRKFLRLHLLHSKVAMVRRHIQILLGVVTGASHLWWGFGSAVNCNINCARSASCRLYIWSETVVSLPCFPRDIFCTVYAQCLWKYVVR